jgi:hypothetical protein
MGKKKKAFVLMPFDSALAPVFEELICPPLRDAGFEPKRSDSQPDMRNVVEEIMVDIGMADLIVALATTRTSFTSLALLTASESCSCAHYSE